MRTIVPHDGYRRHGHFLKGVAGLGLVFSWVLALSPSQAFAQRSLAGQIENVIGTLVVVRPDGIEERVQGKSALQLFEWDVLRTEPGSQALLNVKDDIQVALNENSVLRILARWEKAKGITRIIRVQQGEIWVKTGAGPKPLEVETPVAAAAVRETEFNIKVLEDGQTILTVIQGVVEFGTPFGTCPIRTSTVSYGVRGKRCTKPEATDVKPAVAWTAEITR
jgi:ferric-dicitrate binding protein FerR (iron transport regulator)